MTGINMMNVQISRLPGREQLTYFLRHQRGADQQIRKNKIYGRVIFRLGDVYCKWTLMQ